MILPNANLLLYAYDSTSPFHKRAAQWLTQILSGTETVVLGVPVLFAYVRISTNPRAFHSPLPVKTAVSNVRAWLDRPMTKLEEMLPQDVERTLDLLIHAGTGGNLTTDAQLAALALRLGATVHTADADFGRFPKVKWMNPLLGK